MRIPCVMGHHGTTILHGLRYTSDFWNTFSWNLVPMGKKVSKGMLMGYHFPWISPEQGYGYIDAMSAEG